jgi:hypothetical protein
MNRNAVCYGRRMRFSDSRNGLRVINRECSTVFNGMNRPGKALLTKVMRE